MWYVVDEFGFTTMQGYSTQEEAEESRIEWDNYEFSIEHNIKHHVEYREE